MRAQNLDPRFPSQSFSPLPTPSVDSEVAGNEVGVRGGGEWHLDIDTKELRWESYVKAGYYVSTVIAYPTDSGPKHDAYIGRSFQILLSCSFLCLR